MSAYPCITLISHCNLQENYRMGGSFVWPTVAKVAEYRKKVRKAILDVIDNTPLELPVTQESKWVRWKKTHMTEQWTRNHCWEIWRLVENSWQVTVCKIWMYCIEEIIYMVARRWILFFLGESNILRTCRASVWNIVCHHKKIKFISSSHWVIFFLLCIHFSFSHSQHKLYHQGFWYFAEKKQNLAGFSGANSRKNRPISRDFRGKK